MKSRLRFLGSGGLPPLSESSSSSEESGGVGLARLISSRSFLPSNEVRAGRPDGSGTPVHQGTVRDHLVSSGACLPPTSELLHPLSFSAGRPSSRPPAWEEPTCSLSLPDPEVSGFAGVVGAVGSTFVDGPLVIRSTREAGQLAGQVGGPSRERPSITPRLTPHKLGMT